MNVQPASIQRPAEPAMRIRPGAAPDLYEFRKVNYADGWDDDDADLGWVDAEIIEPKRKRGLH